MNGWGMNPRMDETLMIASASLGAHLRQDGLRHADHAEDVDVEDALVLRDGGFLGSAR